jgi:hypothetical protein
VSADAHPADPTDEKTAGAVPRVTVGAGGGTSLDVLVLGHDSGYTPRPVRDGTHSGIYTYSQRNDCFSPSFHARFMVEWMSIEQTRKGA